MMYILFCVLSCIILFTVDLALHSYNTVRLMVDFFVLKSKIDAAEPEVSSFTPLYNASDYMRAPYILYIKS